MVRLAGTGGGTASRVAPSPGSTLKPGPLLGRWGAEGPVALLGSHSIRELPGLPLQEGAQTPHPTVQSTAGGVLKGGAWELGGSM